MIPVSCPSCGRVDGLGVEKSTNRLVEIVYGFCHDGSNEYDATVCDANTRQHLFESKGDFFEIVIAIRSGFNVFMDTLRQTCSE